LELFLLLLRRHQLGQLLHHCWVECCRIHHELSTTLRRSLTRAASPLFALATAASVLLSLIYRSVLWLLLLCCFYSACSGMSLLRCALFSGMAATFHFVALYLSW
jgi:hypothetical protein